MFDKKRQIRWRGINQIKRDKLEKKLNQIEIDKLDKKN